MAEEIFVGDSAFGDLLQQISGQLRSSLVGIHGALQSIAPPELRDGDKQMDERAAVFYKSYYRLLRLCNNLADVTAPESAMRLRMVNDDIVGICREVMERAEYPAEMLGLKTAFQCDRKTQIIAVDAEGIQRMLLNLLSNAFKFTPRGGSVTLAVQVLPDVVELKLTDTGVGIAPELLDTVFERYAIPTREDALPHGMGFGLPISRRIARVHGGGLVLHSQPGRGTTVTVTLPNRKNRTQALRTLAVDYSGGFNTTLVELSDVLPDAAFTQKFLD